MAEQSSVQFESNAQEIIELLGKASDTALKVVGMQAKGYAMALAKGTWGGPLGLDERINYDVDDGVLSVGADANFEIAAYVELGTATEYEAPPEWMQNAVQEGKYQFGKQGISKWWYRDEVTGGWKPGAAQKPHPYLRPAIMDHVDEYKAIIEAEMKDAD